MEVINLDCYCQNGCGAVTGSRRALCPSCQENLIVKFRTESFLDSGKPVFNKERTPRQELRQYVQSGDFRSDLERAGRLSELAIDLAVQTILRGI